MYITCIKITGLQLGIQPFLEEATTTPPMFALFDFPDTPWYHIKLQFCPVRFCSQHHSYVTLFMACSLAPAHRWPSSSLHLALLPSSSDRCLSSTLFFHHSLSLFELIEKYLAAASHEFFVLKSWQLTAWISGRTFFFSLPPWYLSVNHSQYIQRTTLKTRPGI